MSVEFSMSVGLSGVSMHFKRTASVPTLIKPCQTAIIETKRFRGKKSAAAIHVRDDGSIKMAKKRVDDPK